MNMDTSEIKFQEINASEALDIIGGSLQLKHHSPMILAG